MAHNNLDDILPSFDTTVIALLPAQNEEKLIAPCLDAVLKNKDIDKVVVVCDRCTDKTYSIAQKISKVNKKCITIEKKHSKYRKAHLGHYTSEARNVGLKVIAKMHPDYVVLVDADSTLPYNHMSRGVKILNKDAHIALVGIKLQSENGESIIDVGSIIRYSIIQKWGGEIKECARDITCMTKMLKAEGYKVEYLKYNNERSILAYDPNDDKLNRKYWGYKGIGYASYECYEPLLWLTGHVLKHVITKQSFHEIGYIIGWISGYIHRAKRIDALKEYSSRQQQKIMKKICVNSKQRIISTFRLNNTRH